LKLQIEATKLQRVIQIVYLVLLEDHAIAHRMLDNPWKLLKTKK